MAIVALSLEVSLSAVFFSALIGVPIGAFLALNRFPGREALSNLAHDIQFIVITHNRKTIEAANTVYGISMGEDSVSEVFSLKIDEWLGEK